MMKRISLVLTTMIFTFSLFLVGCGGSSSNAAPSYENVFLGTWNAVEMSGDTSYSKEQMEAFRSLGFIDVYINFEQDGKAYLCNVTGGKTTSVEGTWTADSATQLTLTLEGNSTPATLEDGVLTIPSTTTTMGFEKVDYREIDHSSIEESSNSQTSGSMPGGASADDASSSSADTSAVEEDSSVSAATGASSQEPAASSNSAEKTASAEFKVSIDGVEVGSDYEGNPALIVTFTWENNSDKTTSYASSLHAKCFQNGVELDTAFTLDGVDNSGYMSDVRPGYGTTFQMAYKLKDTESPVEIEVSELFNFNGDILVSKTFEL